MFESLEAFGDRICLILEDKTSVSYRDLVRLSDSLSEQLGHERKLVLLEVRNTLPSVVAIVACLRSHHPFVLCSDKNRAGIEVSFRPNVRVDSGGRVTRYSDHGIHRLHPDLSILLSTSGSTGSARLVRLSESASLSNADAIAEYLKIGNDERAVTSLPISYSYGFSVLMSHLSVGASIVLSEYSVVDDAFWDLFGTQHVTSLAGVPYTYELLEAIRFRERSYPSLRYMTQAGGRLAPELVRRYASWCMGCDIRFYTMYGQTEAAPRMAYLPPELALSHPDYIGRAIPGGTLRVVDSEGRTVVGGTTGELVYAGPNVMMGYARGPDDLARGAELTELHTGDMAREEQAGLFKIVGRLSRFSKIAGLRIDLDDLERLLAEAGHNAVVAGNDNLISVGVIGSAACIPALDAVLEKFIPISVQSRVVFALIEVPRLSSGKIDYQHVLAAGIATHHEEVASRAMLFHHQESVASEFSRVLYLETVDGKQSFSSLGGNSLAYVELSTALERKLGRSLLGWEHLTVDQLDTLLSESPRPSSESFSQMSTEVALRAVAIALIVAHHTLTMDLGGGMEMLLLLVGINLARSQPWRPGSSSRRKFLRDVGLNLLLPYYVVLACATLGHFHHVSWSFWLLLSNWIPPQDWFSLYWFVAAYVQVVLIVFTLANIASIRRLMVEKSGTFGGLFLLGALLAKAGALAVFQHFDLRGRTPDQFIYVVALGWCFQTAKTTRTRISLIVAASCIAVIDWSGVAPTVWSGFGGRWRDGFLLASMILLTQVKSVPVPLVVRQVLTRIAVASLMIYLTHPLLLALSEPWFSAPRRANPVCYLAIACFIVFGVAMDRAADFCRRRGVRFEKWFDSYIQARKRLPA